MNSTRRIALAVTLTATLSCNDEVTGLPSPSDPATETFAASLGVDIASMTKTPEGVYYADVLVGTGPVDSTLTDSLRLTYSGHLKDGSLFDSGTNVLFTPGAVVAGFRIGLVGAKEGGKRKIVIPSELGYKSQSIKDPNTLQIKIPRQSTLVFDVELLKVYNRPDTAGASAVVSRP